VLDRVPARALDSSPRCRRVGLAAEGRVNLAGDVERCMPALVALLNEPEIVADAVKPRGQHPDATPGVEPAMQQAQLRCLRQEMREAERGGEVAPTLGVILTMIRPPVEPPH